MKEPELVTLPVRTLPELRLTVRVFRLSDYLHAYHLPFFFAFLDEHRDRGRMSARRLASWFDRYGAYCATGARPDGPQTHVLIETADDVLTALRAFDFPEHLQHNGLFHKRVLTKYRGRFVNRDGLDMIYETFRPQWDAPGEFKRVTGRSAPQQDDTACALWDAFLEAGPRAMTVVYIDEQGRPTGKRETIKRGRTDADREFEAALSEYGITRRIF